MSSGIKTREWKVSRAFKSIGSGTTPKSGTSEYYDEGSINWLITGDLNDGEITATSKKITPKAVSDYSTLKTYPANSLVIAMYGATIAKVGLLKIPTTVNQACCVLVPSKRIDPRYAYYYFLSSKRKLIDLGSGGGQPNISQDVVRSFKITLPEKSEQKKMVNYLDTKTQTLDKILTAKNHTHTHLSELRQAIITNAVLGTGGTAMNLQDTHIPWIGKIPAHWEVKKIKHVATVKARIGWQSLTTDEYIDKGPFLVTGTDFRDGTVDWKTAAHVSDQRWAIDSNIQLEEDDLLLTKDGTIGKVAMVKGLVGKATLNSGVFVIRAKNDEYNPRYLYHILNSGVFTDFIEYMKTGSTINHLYQQTFVEFSFPMPPRKEQDEIVKLIDHRLRQVDIAIEKVVKSTSLLEEYRSSLISNVVGGKVEV